MTCRSWSMLEKAMWELSYDTKILWRRNLLTIQHGWFPWQGSQLTDLVMLFSWMATVIPLENGWPILRPRSVVHGFWKCFSWLQWPFLKVFPWIKLKEKVTEPYIETSFVWDLQKKQNRTCTSFVSLTRLQRIPQKYSLLFLTSAFEFNIFPTHFITWVGKIYLKYGYHIYLKQTYSLLQTTHFEAKLKTSWEREKVIFHRSIQNSLCIRFNTSFTQMSKEPTGEEISFWRSHIKF